MKTSSHRKERIQIDPERVLPLIKDGMRAKEIASLLGCSTPGIYSLLKREGIKIKSLGEASAAHRYSDSFVERARVLREQGFSLRAIRERLNVPISTLHEWTEYKIRTGISLRS